MIPNKKAFAILPHIYHYKRNHAAKQYSFLLHFFTTYKHIFVYNMIPLTVVAVLLRQERTEAEAVARSSIQTFVNKKKGKEVTSDSFALEDNITLFTVLVYSMIVFVITIIQ